MAMEIWRAAILVCCRGQSQPSFHARMETAEIVHHADPFQNRPALGASRESTSKLPSVAVAVCRKMSTFVHSTMSLIRSLSGAGPKANLPISIR